jgi:uncharacterized protein
VESGCWSGSRGRISLGSVLTEAAAPEPILAALRDFRSGLHRRFGDRLRELRLFGSRARGDARQESDADVLVVLDEVSRPDFVTVMDLCGDVLAGHGVLVDPFLISAEAASKHRMQKRPLMTEIDREGRPL